MNDETITPLLESHFIETINFLKEQRSNLLLKGHKEPQVETALAIATLRAAVSLNTMLIQKIKELDVGPEYKKNFCDVLIECHKNGLKEVTEEIEK